MPVLASRVNRRKGKKNNLSRLDDPQVVLMLRVQREEPGAFAELVERFGPIVFGRFYRQLGDRQDAEDLTQEVFLRVYRHRKRYQPRAKFSTWLFHITQNVGHNAIRSRLRHPAKRLNLQGKGAEDGLEGGLNTRDGESPSLPLERKELADIVRKAVLGLADRQRAALELHQFQDMTYAEVARELEMSPKAAKSLLYRARNQLRIHLTTLLHVTD